MDDMGEEVKERAPMEDWDEVITAQATGGGEFEDYVKLDAGEPFKAHITAVKKGTKTYMGEEQTRMFVYFKLDEGPGKDQVYRGDFNPKLTTPDSPKQSNLAKFAEMVYGEKQTKLDKDDLIGRPIRVLLSEPWGDKQLQFVNSYLKPAPDQKRVEPDVVPNDVSGNLEAEVMKTFEGAEVVAEEN